MTSLPTPHRPRYTDRYTARWSRSLREGKGPEGTGRDLTGRKALGVLPVVQGVQQFQIVEFRTSQPRTGLAL